MKNLLRLAYVIYKGNGLANFSGDTGKRKRRLSKVASILLFSFLAIYMIAIMSVTSIGVYNLLAPVGLQSILISMILSAGVMLVFFFGVLYVISIFYYASDVEKILPLPLRADEIIGAKLLVTAAYEYIYLTVLVAPVLIIYGIRSGSGLPYYLMALIVLIVLPVIPLCFSAVLVMLIMRFTTLARNKDRFNMIAGILAMGLSLAFVFSSQSLISFSEKDLVRILGSSAEDLARLTSTIFPGTSYAAAALAGPFSLEALGQLGLLLLIAALAVVITLQFGRLLYFKGVIGLGSANANRRRLTGRELEHAGKSGSAFWTYVQKDVRILLRTPIFFMNNVLMNFLWPIFILIPFMSNKQGDGLNQIIQILKQTAFSSDSQGSALALAIAFGFACFVTGTNGIAESALSREGKLLYIMKILPMSYTRQLWAKLMAGIIFSLCGTLVMSIVFVVLLQPPIWFVLLLLAMLPGATLLPNLSGIIFELFWPKLNWDNEQKAVKQNLNVLYGILLALLLAALVIVPVVAWKLSIVPAALLICLVPLLLAAGLAVLIHRIGPRQLLSMDV